MYTLRTVYKDGKHSDVLIGQEYTWISSSLGERFNKTLQEIESIKDSGNPIDANLKPLGIIIWANGENDKLLFTCNQHYIVMPNGQTLTMLK